MNKKEAGFTLVETLLTLFITSILIFIPIISLDHITESIQIDLFFRELSTNITLMQNHALLAGERTEVQFYPNQNVIKFKVYDGNNFSTHQMDRTMDLNNSFVEFSNKNGAFVGFQKDTGNIKISESRWWTTPFTTTKGEYELVFQMGSGRFEIRKK